jgi:hypothetical protein
LGDAGEGNRRRKADMNQLFLSCGSFGPYELTILHKFPNISNISCFIEAYTEFIVFNPASGFQDLPGCSLCQQIFDASMECPKRFAEVIISADVF